MPLGRPARSGSPHELLRSTPEPGECPDLSVTNHDEGATGETSKPGDLSVPHMVPRSTVMEKGAVAFNVPVNISPSL